MKVIEVKILDVNRDEFISKLNQQKISDEEEFLITESYWLSPLSSDRVRIREYELLTDHTSRVFLTIKKDEEAADRPSILSTRNEVNVEMFSEKDAMDFLDILGFRRIKVLQKERYKFRYNDLCIQFDKMGDLNWMEVEAPSESLVYAFLFEMGYSLNDLCNKSTEDLHNEQVAKGWEK